MTISDVITKFDLDVLEIDSQGKVYMHMGRELSKHEWLQLVSDIADLELEDE